MSLVRSSIVALKTALRSIVGARNYAAFGRLVTFCTWLVPALSRTLQRVPTNGRRLLVVYDMSSQPFSIGDILIMQEAALVLKEREKANEIDFAIVFNPKQPAPPDPAFQNITEENALYNLASVLPVAQVNQYLGSLFLFNSHSQLECFIASNADGYYVWPTPWKYATKEYLDYEIFDNLLYNHFKKHAAIPCLICRPFLAEWARKFFEDNAPGLLPVTINIRNNASFHIHRNSNLDAWLEFFCDCEKKYPVRFFVMCAWAEIDDRLRNCSNVVVTKDHHTSIEQELALVSMSTMHMGVGSGPISMAWFNDKPYLMVNTVYGPGHFARSDMIQAIDTNLQKFWFANDFQRISPDPETAAFLIKQFSVLIQAANRALTENSHSANLTPKGNAVGSWLR